MSAEYSVKIFLVSVRPDALIKYNNQKLKRGSHFATETLAGLSTFPL